MKQKKTVSIIGILIFAIGITALISGCSQTRKVQGVWQLTKEDGKAVPATPANYYCFTSNNIMYHAQKDSSGLKRSEPIAYTVDGNKLIIGLGGNTTFEIHGNTATLTSTNKDLSGNESKYVQVFTKVSSPTVDEIKEAKQFQFQY